MITERWLNLVAAVRKLPGVGPKMAERISIHLMRSDDTENILRAIADAKQHLRRCTLCGTFTDDAADVNVTFLGGKPGPKAFAGMTTDCGGTAMVVAGKMNSGSVFMCWNPPWMLTWGQYEDRACWCWASAA